MATRLFHIATRGEWLAAGETYAPAAYATEGFVHCSFAEQVEATRSRSYAGRDDVVLLEVDPALLTARLLVEPSPTTGELFPHVYGPVDRAAVVRVHPLGATRRSGQHQQAHEKQRRAHAA